MVGSSAGDDAGAAAGVCDDVGDVISSRSSWMVAW